MSSAREALDRIKARTEEQPDDSGSAVELSELLDVARDDSLRLTEALEAVMTRIERQEKEGLLIAPDPLRRLIEDKLSEGEG